MPRPRLAVAALLLAASPLSAAFAQEPPLDEEPLASPFGDVPEARRRRNIDDLREAPASERSIDEPRSSAPGVELLDARRAASEGTQTAAGVLEAAPAVWAATGSRGERIFDLRGFEQRQVRVSLDGVPLLLPYDGQIDLAKIPAAALDHVTLASGSGSSIYGANGLAGTVNLVTHRPGEGPVVQLLAEAGSGAERRFHGRHSYRQGALAWVIGAGYETRDETPLPGTPVLQLLPVGARAAAADSGQWLTNSDRELLSLLARASLDLDHEHRVELGAKYLDGTFGVPPEQQAAVAEWWRFNAWRMLSFTAGHAGRLGPVELDELLYVSWYDNRLDAYDDATYATQDSPGAFRSWFHDLSAGARLRAGVPLPLLPLSAERPRADVWLEVRHDEHQDEQRLSPGAPETHTQRGDTVSATLLTLAPELTVPLGRAARAGAGLQADVELPDGDQAPLWALGPLASLRARLAAGLEASVSASRRSRFPTLKERFASRTGSRTGNPDLEPESAWSLGAELENRPGDWLSLRLSLFESEVAKLVEDLPRGDGTSRLTNVGDARLAGGELTGSVRWHRVVELSLFYGYLYGRLTSDDGAARSGRLQYRPTHRGGGKATLYPIEEVSLSATAVGAGPASFVDRRTGTWGRLGPHVTLNARLAYELFGWGSLWARADNLLDSRYQTRHGFPEPGRRLFVGLELSPE